MLKNYAGFLGLDPGLLLADQFGLREYTGQYKAQAKPA